MSTIILHHFDASPYAEKIRVVLGMKELPWQSVQIPMVMPKPDLTALTGGYRKTPVMQIGADVYCDTQRIADELESRFPTPSLFPNGCRGQALAIGSWADNQLFQPGAGLSMGTNMDLPADILEDRFAFFDFLDREKLPQELPHLFAQFHANLHRLQDMLADGRSWLLGESPSWADAASYASVWMCRGNIRGAQDLLKGMDQLQAWEKRVNDLGHGQHTDITPQQAHKISHSSGSIAKPEIGTQVWPTLKLDSLVTVTPDDYGTVPVTGKLIRLTHCDIAIKRSDEKVGDLVIHFPRVGYTVEGI